MLNEVGIEIQFVCEESLRCHVVWINVGSIAHNYDQYHDDTYEGKNSKQKIINCESKNQLEYLLKKVQAMLAVNTLLAINTST